MDGLTPLSRPTKTESSVVFPEKRPSEGGFEFPRLHLLNKDERVPLSPEYLDTDPSFSHRLFAISNTKGWFAAATNAGGQTKIVASPLSDLRCAFNDEKPPPLNALRSLTFTFGIPTVLAFAFSETRLLVGTRDGSIVVFDTATILSPGNAGDPITVLRHSPSPVRDIVPNPGQDPGFRDMTAILRHDGSIQVLTSSLEIQGGWVPVDADSAAVACSWSPRGKQIGVALLHGDILTFTPDNKSTPQKHVPATAQGRRCTGLNWLAPGFTFRITYAPKLEDDADVLNHAVYLHHKSNAATVTVLPYPFGAFGRSGCNPFAMILPHWDRDAPSEEVQMYLAMGDFFSVDFEMAGCKNTEWFADDPENKPCLPLDKNDDDTWLLGLATDLTDLESQQPVMFGYLNDGTVIGWQAVHSKPYVGMIEPNASASAPVSAPPPSTPSLRSTPAFGQSGGFSQSQPSSAGFGQPQSTSAFGQPQAASTGFGQSQSSSSGFGQSGSAFGGAPSASPGFGAPLFSSTGGGFSDFGGSNVPFGQQQSQSSFGSAPQTPPEESKDSDMTEDSGPFFGGLSLGEPNTTDTSKPSAGDIFGTPAPPSTNNSSAFGGGGGFSGGLIKPGTGFGASAFSSDSPFAPKSSSSSGGSSAFGGGAFGGGSGAFSSKPAQSNSAFGGGAGQPVFGQSSFGQRPPMPAFGQPSFGQPAFGQPAFSGNTTSSLAPSSGGFSSFATKEPSPFGASGQPGARPSAFGAGPTKEEDKSITGVGFTAFAGSGPSPFRTPTQQEERKTSTSGGSSAFASSGPLPVAQQEEKRSEGPSAFGGPRPSIEPTTAASDSISLPTSSPPKTSTFGSATTSVFGQPSFGQPAPSSNSPSITSSFGQQPKSVFGQPSFSQPSQSAFDDEAAPATSSSDGFSSFANSSPSPFGSAPTPAPAKSSFSEPKPSTFKLSEGSGAFGGGVSTDSPFMKAATNRATPTVTAFGGFSQPSTPSTTASPAATSGKPVFGAPSMLGVRSAITSAPSSNPAKPASEPTSGGFASYSKGPSGFSAYAGPQKSFKDLTATEERRDGGQDVEEAPSTPKKGPEAAKKSEPESPSTPNASLQDRDKTPVFTPPPKASTPPAEEGEKAPKAGPSTSTASVDQGASIESISSQTSSFVNVSRDEGKGSDDDEESEEPPEDEEESFLSDSVIGRSDPDDRSDDSEEEHEGDERADSEGDDDTTEEAEPANIPLPPSRSPSATPPSITVSSSPSAPGKLSTITEESTTPPGSPTKTTPIAPKIPVASPMPAFVSSPPVFGSPAPASASASPSTPSSGLFGRPNTRPTRSSPLANTISVSGSEDESEEDIKGKGKAPLKPRPASPRAPFGVMPTPKVSKAESEPLASPKLPRPKTPPLLFTPKSRADIKPGASFPPSAMPKGSPSISPLASKEEEPKKASAAPPVSLPGPFSMLQRPPGGSLGGIASFGQAASSTPRIPVAFPPPNPTTADTELGNLEDGMQKECARLFIGMNKELEDLRHFAQYAASKLKSLQNSPTPRVKHQKEDLCDPSKWGFLDLDRFRLLLKEYDQDIDDLQRLRQKQKKALKDVRSGLLKAETRRREIDRFKKAKSDGEFTKMLKARGLGPEHLENQIQLRRSIKSIQSRVEQLEGHLNASKKRLSEMRLGKPSLRAPTLESVNRTRRNMDLFTNEQERNLDKLAARIRKLDPGKDLISSKFSSSVLYRDPRLPDPALPPVSPTNQVAITTAAALNAERSAARLKKALLAVRSQPLLNKSAAQADTPPIAFGTPTRPDVPGTSSSFRTLQSPFSTPTKPGTDIDGPDFYFPEDIFSPGTPLTTSRGGLSRSSKQANHAPGVKRHGSPSIPAVSQSPAHPSPSPSFDWGPLPDFSKGSGSGIQFKPLPGFAKLMGKGNTK